MAWWSLDLYWPQLIHHRVAPLFAALDCLLVTRTGRGRWWRPLTWLGYPAAFLVVAVLLHVAGNARAALAVGPRQGWRADPAAQG